jgi:hypothetical protein
MNESFLVTCSLDFDLPRNPEGVFHHRGSEVTEDFSFFAHRETMGKKDTALRGNTKNKM